MFQINIRKKYTMKNKLGFTLVELLGVIVILAIISLIAIPIVLNIINVVKKSSTESSIKMIEHAAQLYYYNSNKQIEMTFICNKGKCSNGENELDIKGETPELGIIKIDNNGEVTLKSIMMNGYICNNDNGYKCEKPNKDNVEEVGGFVHINDNKSIKVTNYRIYGNSIQNGTPTPDTPIEIKNVGDLVTDTTSNNYGKYEIKIKIVGKNLFNINDALTSEAWDIVSYKYYPIYVGTENNIIVSYNDNLELGLGFYFVVGRGEEEKGLALGNWLYHSTATNLIKNQQTFTSQSDYIYLNVAGNFNNADNYILDNNFQIELNTEKTEYEAYKEQIYNIYLNEPLRCVGDVCDYIDFNEGKVVRKIKSRKLSSSDTWSTYDSNTNELPVYWTKYEDSYRSYGHSMCSHFNHRGTAWAYGLYGQYSDHPNNNTKYFVTNLETLEEWKKWIDDNEVMLNFILLNPEEQKIILPEIYLNEDISNIIIDTEIKPSKLELEYYK